MMDTDLFQLFYSIHDDKSNDIGILTCKNKRILITLQIKYYKKDPELPKQAIRDPIINIFVKII